MHKNSADTCAHASPKFLANNRNDNIRIKRPKQTSLKKYIRVFVTGCITCASARIYRSFIVIDILRVSTDKNLRTTHPFLYSFVSSFLIPPPGVTSPRGGSSDQGLRRGHFTRAANRVPPSGQIIALEMFSRDRRVKEI